jgi:hypothetical protein
MRTSPGAMLLAVLTIAACNEDAVIPPEPERGTFAASPPSDTQLGFVALYTRQTSGMVVAFTSRAGELVLTESSRARLEGTFAFRATAIMPGETEEREVVVEGTFSATCATQFCGS